MPTFAITNAFGARSRTTPYVPRRPGSRNAARWLHEHGATEVVVKLGAEGCYVLGLGPVPAPRVESVDGTGAGDAFVAGLLYGRLAGWPLERASRLGNAAGALATTRVGATEGVRPLGETLALAGLE